MVVKELPNLSMLRSSRQELCKKTLAWYQGVLGR